MKIYHTYHRREVRIEIVSSLAGKLRSKALGLFAVLAAFAFCVFQFEPKSTHLPGLSVLAFFALALALGRWVYLIKPGHHVRFQLRMLGIPVISSFIDAATFHSTAILGETGGSVDLRFVNAEGESVLTIEGFPDPESAGQVAALFNLDEVQQRKASGNLIDRVMIAERKLSQWPYRLLVSVAFVLSPGLAWLFREGMDGLWNHLIAGFFMVLITAYISVRDHGIIAVSKEGGYIDYWARRRLFQRIEYRKHLTGDAEVSLLESRFDNRYLLIGLLLLCQFATIYLIVLRNEAADNSQRTEFQELLEQANDEDVRRGGEKFQELLNQRKMRTSIPPDE